MSFDGHEVDLGEGVFGIGTNKQTAYFSDLRMSPIRVPKAEKKLVDKEELMKMVDSLGGGPDVDAELPVAPVMETPELPTPALGMDGGMAPKIENVSQDEILTIDTCSKKDSPELRNG